MRPGMRRGKVLRSGMAAGGLAGLLVLSACEVGPDYRRPDAPVPAAYKESTQQLPPAPAGWKWSEPQDQTDRGAWWTIFGDEQLDQLEHQVNISNQNVKEFEAQYRQAQALLQEAKAQLYPTLSVSAGVQRGGGGGGASSTSSSVGSSAAGAPRTQYTVEPNLSWQPDVWGTVRRQIESSKANVQVGAADLANTQLSAQATLAEDYFELRAADSLQQLLTDSVAQYQRELEITRNQFRAGTASSGDVATSETQLEQTQAQLVSVEQQRGTYEHAIAVLTGHLPAELTLASAPLTSSVPAVPPQLPSTLLERNPGIAAAERQVQQESALIGVAVGAYYPQISLSAIGGYAGDPLSKLFSTGSRIWSLAGTASDKLFAGGAQVAAVDAAHANYDQAVATYRQTVLTAFQQVEDQLLALRVLQQQADLQAAAVKSAQTAETIALNEFNAGTVPYTTVISAHQTTLAGEQTALTIQQNRLVASVTLIEALGGGWDASRLSLDKPERSTASSQ